MATALSGDPGTAGRDLATLMPNFADRGLPLRMGPAHPFLQGVQRMTAARWLLQSGDTLAARRLLPWYEAGPPRLPAP